MTACTCPAGARHKRATVGQATAVGSAPEWEGASIVRWTPARQARARGTYPWLAARGCEAFAGEKPASPGWPVKTDTRKGTSRKDPRLGIIADHPDNGTCARAGGDTGASEQP